MILYADSSALAKRYLVESGSKETEALVRAAEVVGTNVITRAEISAAIAKAVRIHLLRRTAGERILKSFRRHWPELAVLQVSEALIADADALAWQFELRGYDAVHLASALLWRESLSEPIVLATFDRQLWNGAKQAGLDVWPDTLP